MKILKLLFIINLIFVGILLSQSDVDKSCYNIPFASKDNSVELTVVNASNYSVTNLQVSGVDIPAWLKIQPAEQLIELLESDEECAVNFSFSIDNTAPVNREQIITLNISTPTGESWTKQISMIIEPPERFELYQNYPNPFNPKTIISFQLPHAEHVVLKIFDIIGREVRTVLNEVKEAGYYEVEFVASELPSGVYFYQIRAKNQVSKTTVARKKMVLLR